MENQEEYYNRAIYTALRIGFIGLLLYYSVSIIAPFIMPVLWGLIISVALYPMFNLLAKKLGGREKLAATIITLIILAILIVPSVSFIGSAISGLRNFAAKMETGSVNIPPPPEQVAEWPVVGVPIYDTWNLASTNFDKAIESFLPKLQELAPQVLTVASSLGTTLLLFIVAVIIAGVMFTKAEPAKKAAISIFKTLVGKHGESFVGISIGTIRSVVQGVLGVAIIQSFLGGLGIWLIDIPAAGLWMLIILFLAIIQLPPLLILGPLAVYAFTIADTTPAVIFAVWSVLVSISDAFLKPMFLGRGVDVPMLAVLLGAIGGMIMAGIIGLFVGAVVLAITYKVFQALLVDDALEQ